MGEVVTFTQILLSAIKGMFPSVLLWTVLPLIPFVIAERIWPIDKPPTWKVYVANVLISLSTVVLSLPIGIAAGLWSAQLGRPRLA